MRILITGGSGFIGSALSVALVRAGHNVRILDNQWRGALRRLSVIEGDYEFIEGDIRDPEVVFKAVKGNDLVCHLAFINGTEFFYSMPELVLDVGVKGIINILDACKKHKISELVLASSSEVYQTPNKIPTPENEPLVIPDLFNPRYSYAAGKIISEIMTINYGRKFFSRTMIFRPHNVYGPDMGWHHVIPQLITRTQDLSFKSEGTLSLPIQGSGAETRAFIFINDFIEALMLMLKLGKHLNVYHIGTEDEVAIEHVAKLVGKYFGRDTQVVQTEGISGGTPRRCPDTTKIKELGFVPKISLAQGIKITARWYEQNRNLDVEQNSNSASKY